MTCMVKRIRYLTTLLGLATIDKRTRLAMSLRVRKCMPYCHRNYVRVQPGQIIPALFIRCLVIQYVNFSCRCKFDERAPQKMAFLPILILGGFCPYPVSHVAGKNVPQDRAARARPIFSPCAWWEGASLTRTRVRLPPPDFQPVRAPSLGISWVQWTRATPCLPGPRQGVGDLLVDIYRAQNTWKLYN